MAILQELLAPSVVTGIVSRIKTPGKVLCNYFGMGIGGPNITQVSGRAYSWDIFDNVRDIAQGRAPGVGPAVVAPNPVGRQTNTFPRAYEKLPLNYETLNNIRSIGQDAGTRDKMGMRYIEMQAKQEKLKHENFREFMLAMAITIGAFDIQFDGENWVPVGSRGGNAGFTVDYLIPAGNKGAAIPGLNPLGAGNIIDASWATAGTDIPTHLDKISIAFMQLCGAPLGLVVTDSTVWNAVLNNTKLQAQGGSVNSVFAEYNRQEITAPDGTKLNVFIGVLRARPWLRWLIVDTGLNINSTYTKFFDGTKATFMIDPEVPSAPDGGPSTWFKMQEGSEIVMQSPWAEPYEAFGFASWMRPWDEPARVELHSLQNCIPEINIPKGLMPGVVVIG